MPGTLPAVSDDLATGTARRAGPVAPIPFGAAFGAWLGAWLLGAVVLAAIAITAMGNELGDELSIPTLTVVSLVGWATFVAMLVVVSRRFGTGDPVSDYAVAFRPIDLVGIPIGVATQFLVVPALYWPLRQIWSDTFSRERLEERAQDLADRADGANAILLVLVVVVGAPIVEELVYRGLLQRSLSNAITVWPALVIASLGFAFIHFAWVELPGLFVAGLVFGAGLVLTGRLGLAIVTHAAFNAAGVAVVLS